MVDSEQQEMEKTKQKYHKSYSDWQEAIQVGKISRYLQCLVKHKYHIKIYSYWQEDNFGNFLFISVN